MTPLALLALLLLPAQDPEPSVSISPPQPAVVPLGSSTRIEITVEGAAPDGAPQVPMLDDARTRLRGPSTSFRSYWTGGSLNTERTTSWTLEIVPRRAGTFTVPPIAITVGGRATRSEPMTFEVVKELAGQERAFLNVRPSATRVWVHEPLRFEVVYGIDAGLNPVQLRGGGYAIEVQAPWLSDLEGAVELEASEPATPGRQMSLLLNGRRITVAYEPGLERGGKRYHGFSFTRAFLPSRVGTMRLPEPVLAFTVASGRRTETFFGVRETDTLYAYGEPLEIEVLPLPEEGRPVPFHDAVGRFRMSASVDRRRVKVGSPVQLRLHIEGLGNIEFLRVPALDDVPGFHLLGHKVDRRRSEVVATYDLTPLSAEVDAIPPVAWSYFDTTPDIEGYRTLRTEPIPIEVLPLGERESLAALPGADTGAVEPGMDDIFDVVDPAVGPAVPPPPRPGPGSAALAALLPWLLIGGAAFVRARRARRRADVAGERGRTALRRFRRALAAGRAPHDALVGYLADRLSCEPPAVIGPDLAQRLRSAGIAVELAEETARVVEEGVAARYGGGAETTRERAEELAARLEGTGKRRPLGADVLVLVLAVLLLGGALRGQDSPGAEGMRAYRDGDYAAAAAIWGRAAEGPNPDARLLYNLGNAYFRSGELGEARAVWERARRAMPRDEALLANLRLVRERLELGTGEGEPFVDALATLRDRFTQRELVWILAALHAVAAGCLVLGWRRPVPRVLGFVALAPGLALAVELLWLRPERPPTGIVVADRAAVVAEPRDGLEPVLTLREGVEVDVLATGPAWSRVRVRGRTGYVPSAAVWPVASAPG